MVKNLPAVRETWVQSLGLEDTLEKGMASRSRILAWRIPWTGRLQPMGWQRVQHSPSNTHFHIPEVRVSDTFFSFKSSKSTGRLDG